MNKYNRIVLVGCGGIGSHLAPPLIRYLASLANENRPKEFWFVDGDKYEEHNSDRQEFARFQTGENKAEAQRVKFQNVAPGMMDYYAYQEYIGEDNVEEIINNGTIVFIAVDNHVCRNIISKFCQTCDNVVLITGANELVNGNVQLFIRENCKNIVQPIEKRHPEIETRDDGDRSQMSCEELEKLPSGGQVIFANHMASALMLQMFWNVFANQSFPFQEIYFDTQHMKTRGVCNE